MRYVARFHDAQELGRVRGLLRSKGIPTHQQQVESARMGEQWALYVCLPEQMEDALKLMRDPLYEPATQVDAAEFEKAVLVPDQALLVRLSTITALILLPLVLGIFYLMGKLG